VDDREGKSRDLRFTAPNLNWRRAKSFHCLVTYGSYLRRGCTVAGSFVSPFERIHQSYQITETSKFVAHRRRSGHSVICVRLLFSPVELEVGTRVIFPRGTSSRLSVLRKPDPSSIFIDLYPSELNISGRHCLFRAIFNHCRVVEPLCNQEGTLA
jgi:hypothetical protein